jgi:hypothetical protein
MTIDLSLLKPAIARVVDAGTAPENSWLGSAFYIGNGYALSALHVVMDLSKAPPVKRTDRLELHFVEAEYSTKATIVAQDVLNDWVVLKCDNAPLVTPIECGTRPKKDDLWATFGFPSIHGNGLVFEGRVIDPDAQESSGSTGRIHALQLYAEQAAAGLGAPMHGFSGAPCIVDNKAVGVLRSTLSATVLDGRGRAQPLTAAGTIFACPAWVIVDRSTPDDRLPLPGGWSKEQAQSNFLVVLSDQEQTADQRLFDVAMNAQEKLPGFELDTPMPIDASKAVSSEPALLEAVRLVCAASVAVFDATGFEPAVMLLLGIRAAVRRGVTILSIGGDYVLGNQLDVPFNLQDANIVSHSTQQESAKDERMTPIPLLAARIERGLRLIGSPFYFDLPVYEAVRRLPADRRGVRPAESGVLVLCSFAKKYIDKNWEQLLKKALFNQWGTLKAKHPTVNLADDTLGVARSFELNSPQLVSRAIYEEMRRAQCCVVDLTEWPSTVLFELGVRLAVSPHPTACMIERNGITADLSPACRSLLELLVPVTLRYDSGQSYLKDEAYASAYGPKAVLSREGVAGGAVYRCVEKHLMVEMEPASRTVYRELLDSAQLFARQSLRGGATKPVGLFPGNRELTEKEEQADFERLLAAWLFIVHRFGEAVALADTGETGVAIREAMNGLYGRHDGRLKDLEPQLLEQLERMQNKLEEE